MTQQQHPPHGQPVQYVPVVPIDPHHGIGMRKAGLVLLIIGGAIFVLSVIIGFGQPLFGGNSFNPMLTVLITLFLAFPLLIVGLILWLVGRSQIRDTAAKLAFMSQQSGRAHS